MSPLDKLEHRLRQGRSPDPMRIARDDCDWLTRIVEFGAIRFATWRRDGSDCVGLLEGRGDPVLPRDPAQGIASPCEGAGWGVARVPAGLGPGWEAGAPFQLFQERAANSFRAAGLPSRLAAGLLGVLNELASNAVEHAQSPTPPIVAYEIGSAGWSICVTDVGCGLRESLARSVRLQDRLRNDLVAMELALQPGISGIDDSGRGNGFATVLHSLTQRRCSLRFRSGAAGALWEEGTRVELSTVTLRVLPERVGFHAAISGPLPQNTQ